MAGAATGIAAGTSDRWFVSGTTAGTAVAAIAAVAAGMAAIVISACVAATLLFLCHDFGLVSGFKNGFLQFLCIGFLYIVKNGHFGGGQIVVHILHPFFVGKRVLNLVFAGCAGAVGLEGHLFVVFAVLRL